MKKGDIFRLKTSDGKAIGGYYVILTTTQSGIYANKLRNGVELQEETKYYFNKDRVIVEEIARFQTDEQTMKAISAPGFQANLSFPLGRYEKLHKQFKEDNVKVFRFFAKGWYAYVTFSDVIKVVERDGTLKIVFINVRKVD